MPVCSNIVFNFHSYMHHTHTYASTKVHHMNTHTHTYASTKVHHMNTHTHTHMHTHGYLHTYMHVLMYTHTYTRTNMDKFLLIWQNGYSLLHHAALSNNTDLLNWLVKDQGFDIQEGTKVHSKSMFICVQFVYIPCFNPSPLNVHALPHV